MKSHNWTIPLDHACNFVHTTQGGRSFVNAQLAFIETSDMPEKLLFLKNVVIKAVSTKKAAGASLDCSHSMTRPSFAGLGVLGPPTNLCLSAFATVSPRVALFSLASHVWGATVSFSSPFLPLQWWRRPEPCMGPGRVFFLKAFSPHNGSDLRTRWRGKRHQPVLAFPIRTGQKRAEILYDRGWLIFMYQF